VLTFEPKYKDLLSVDQLVGKTIAAVIPTSAEHALVGESPAGWILEFTDGDRVELSAHYDDSEVFWKEPTTPAKS
jgi:hypothetical protein